MKRTLTSLLPVASNRVGSCTSCGACCELPFPCTFLRYDEDGKSSCAIYALRPPTCRKYPRTEKEFLTAEKCGYSFVNAAAQNTPTNADVIDGVAAKKATNVDMIDLVEL